ncbi:MAG: MBL fold metallo-hydrolase [Crocinitomicaceae bacterium]|nr:MBL fold metallo-hydrolase [Crocinitomicaceae bacterium]
MKFVYSVLISLVVLSCSQDGDSNDSLSNYPSHSPQDSAQISTTSIVILGTSQDAGFPQIACTKDCCKDVFGQPELHGKVSSLGLIDVSTDKTYIFDATPDFAEQMKSITSLEMKSENEFVDGIFLTHAHIGHYTGLMYLGKEATDANKVPVYAMPRMKTFLTNDGPWSQLVSRENIEIEEMQDETAIKLSDDLEVMPFTVPHRDEFSETVGFRIEGPRKTALFIPDIDKWEKWSKDIVEEIKNVDYAFLDATFFSGAEINNRDISQIPHPFIIESFETFKDLSEEDKAKIVFIHFNHTNPVLNPESKESMEVLEKGFRIGRRNEVFEL